MSRGRDAVILESLGIAFTKASSVTLIVQGMGILTRHGQIQGVGGPPNFIKREKKSRKCAAF